ncbi:MAG: sigma-70 family RNA polymerase sigma factor [bacterium]|nr:sigma-70 family RNA polymerase sigma factor [bacterium]MDY4108812.1 sigma-70 family RNA polymerase sigma factor [Bacilli bacterium]
MYDDYNDNELIYLIYDFNEDANRILHEKYYKIIKIKVAKYRVLAKRIGLDTCDLMQEGLLGLEEAINSYRDNKDMKFSSFANMCIERQILSVLNYHSRKKHTFLNDSCSIDVEDEKGRTMLDYSLKSDIDPLMMMEKEEEKNSIYDLMTKDLSKLEKEVFELKLNGLDYREIARLLNKSYKSIDSALQRIRVKLKKILNEMGKNID